MRQQAEYERFGLMAKAIAVKALIALSRHQWDGAALVEEQTTVAGRTVRVTIEEVRDGPPARTPLNGRTVEYDNPPPLPASRRQGRKPGRCALDIQLAIQRAGHALGYAELVRGLADRHGQSTVRSNLRRLEEQGFVIRLDENGPYSLPDDE